MGLKHENFTYQDIGEIMLGILDDEGEPMEDFLSDWGDYTELQPPEGGGEVAYMESHFKSDPRYKPLLKVAHSLVMEYTRGEYRPITTIKNFLSEMFTRCEKTLIQGTGKT